MRPTTINGIRLQATQIQALLWLDQFDGVVDIVANVPPAPVTMNTFLALADKGLVSIDEAPFDGSGAVKDIITVQGAGHEWIDAYSA